MKNYFRKSTVRMSHFQNGFRPHNGAIAWYKDRSKRGVLKLAGIITFISTILLLQLIPAHARNTTSYVNDELNFSIEYPENWINGQKYSPFAVLQVNDPSGSPDLGINVSDLIKDTDLNNSPEEWINSVKNIPGTDNFKTDYKKNIELNDGTNAVKAKISWTIQEIPIMTSLIALDKDDKRIIVNSSGPANISFKVMEGITDSFKFRE